MACLYLVRHAMAEPAGSVCAGCRTDGPLTAEGQAQARVARAWVQGMQPAPVYASPLRRSRETARLLAGPDGEIRVRRALRELDMGEWDGKRFTDIRAQYPELYAARGKNQALMPPGAESFPAAAARMSRTLAAIAAPLDEQEERVVVSHSGAIRAFLCRITGLPYRRNRRLALPYGGICAVEYGPAGWRCLQAGVPASRLPDPPAIEALWREYGAGESARLHGERWPGWRYGSAAVWRQRAWCWTRIWSVSRRCCTICAAISPATRRRPPGCCAAADISVWRRWWRFMKRETTGPNPTRKGWCSWRTSWCRDARKPPSWPALPKAGINAAHPRPWPPTSGG